MKQLTETYHRLEMRSRPNLAWHKPTAGMYRPAEILAYEGRLAEALEAAQRIEIENYGSMKGVSFRVVTNTTMVSVLTGPIE